MAAFGLTQGAMAADSFYVFYRQGFGDAVLNVNFPGATGGFTAFYRPNSLDVVSGIRSVALMEVKHYPNPVAAGEVLTLQAESQIPAGRISFSDITGRVVHRADFEQSPGNQMNINVPAQIFPGLYFYQIHDGKVALTGVGKVMVR